MKKLLFMIVVVFCFIVMPCGVHATGDVTIYVFRGSTCPHCEEALEYFNKHKDQIPEGVSVVTYEVWDNSNNSKLLDAVSEKLGEKTGSVPFFVIGNESIVGYNGVVAFNKIISTAENYLEDESYTDVVKEQANELGINVKSMTLDELYSEPNKTVTIVVYSIFGIVVLGFLGMIIFSRK